MNNPATSAGLAPPGVESGPSSQDIDAAIRLAGFDGPFAARVLRQLATQVVRLERELARYREGLLSPEEMHNLCHNLHLRGTPLTEPEFAAGCDRFRDYLFRSGENLPPAPTRYDLLWEIIDRVACTSCKDSIVDAVGEADQCPTSHGTKPPD